MAPIDAVEAPELDELEALVPKIELLEEDGERLESAWHVAEIQLLLDSVACWFRDRSDYYAAGNMFVYYSLTQAQEVKEEVLKKKPLRAYRGPDFLFVNGVNRLPLRRYWVVWQEGGRYPDVVIELSSPKTARMDRTTKKAIYEKVFRTPEYYIYDPLTQQLDGWRLASQYEALSPNGQGRLESRQLGLWLGTWQGSFQGAEEVWLRFFDAQGQLVPFFAEAEYQRAEGERQRAEAERQRAEAEHQRAEAERRRAEAAEAEIVRLKAQLASGESSSTRRRDKR